MLKLWGARRIYSGILEFGVVLQSWWWGGGCSDAAKKAVLLSTRVRYRKLHFSPQVSVYYTFSLKNARVVLFSNIYLFLVFRCFWRGKGSSLFSFYLTLELVNEISLVLKCYYISYHFFLFNSNNSCPHFLYKDEYKYLSEK